MNQQLIEHMIKQVADELGVDTAPLPAQRTARQTTEVPGPAQKRPMTEYIGQAAGHTIGLLIAAVDPKLQEILGLNGLRSLGIIGSRIGAGPQTMAADEAVKSTSSSVLSVEYPRDSMGGAGRGCLIYIGAENVSDAKRAVEITLEQCDKYYGDIYSNEAGHLELQYTANAGECLQTAYGAPAGRAFGLITAAPAAIGTVLADAAVKAAEVAVTEYRSPANGNSFSNEILLAVSGDSGAVRQAVITAREAGKELLRMLGKEPASGGTPYI